MVALVARTSKACADRGRRAVSAHRAAVAPQGGIACHVAGGELIGDRLDERLVSKHEAASPKPLIEVIDGEGIRHLAQRRSHEGTTNPTPSISPIASGARMRVRDGTRDVTVRCPVYCYAVAQRRRLVADAADEGAR